MRAAHEAMAARGTFRLCLAGGTTPREAYRLLAAQDVAWVQWQLYYGDERCLPVDDPQRNSHMVRAVWLDRADFPVANHHPIPAELGAAEGARAYAALFPAALPFDMVLLGMGEDGHTASLFPGHTHAPEATVHAVYNSPKPPPERVSLSRATLEQTRALLVLVTGAGKYEAVQAWREGAALPVASLTPACGVEVLVDEAAWSGSA